MATDEPEFYGVHQVAKILGITGRAVRYRVEAGTLAATKLGTGTASYVITRAEVERVKAGRTAA